MKSASLRRLEDRVDRTTLRLVAYAERYGLSAADLAGTKLPWYQIRSQAGTGAPTSAGESTDVLIYDEIGGSMGVSAGTFAESLAKISTPNIRLRINSPGGSVRDALAIRSSLRHHPSRVTAYVDGLAASAATIIALGAEEVVMMDGTQFMIHDPTVTMDVQPADIEALGLYLNRQADNIAELYQLKGGKDIGYWRELMTAETWMFGPETVEFGLADRTETRADAPATLGAEDAEAEELMTRTHRLTQYRYAGREHAPAPGLGPRQTRRAPAPETRAAEGPRIELLEHMVAVMDMERGTGR